MVLPVANPSANAGFLRTAPAINCAAWRLISSSSRFRITSMRRRLQTSLHELLENDELANAQQGIAAGNGENIGDSRVSRGRVHLFIGVAKFNLVIAFEYSEKRFPADGCVQEP